MSVTDQMTVESPEVSAVPEYRSLSGGKSTLRFLTTNEFSTWDALVDASSQGSVFCRRWWLEATCGNPTVLGLFEKERLVAGMPLYFVRRFGLRFCTMPKLTQAWGVVMSPRSEGRCTTASREMDLLRPFADYVSRFPLFDQRFHHTVQNFLPFFWKGFVETSRLSQEIEDITQSDAVWAAMAGNVRQNVRKAEKNGLFVVEGSENDLWDIEAKTFGRQHKNVSYSKQYLTRLLGAAITHNQGCCLAVRDGAGRIHAAGFFVWDSRQAHYLVCGSDQQVRTNGASSLLLWHILQYLAGRTRSFNFGGSMLEGVERFNRNFGSHRVVYPWVMKFPLAIYVHFKHSWEVYTSGHSATASK